MLNESDQPRILLTADWWHSSKSHTQMQLRGHVPADAVLRARGADQRRTRAAAARGPVHELRVS